MNALFKQCGDFFFNIWRVAQLCVNDLIFLIGEFTCRIIVCGPKHRACKTVIWRRQINNRQRFTTMRLSQNANFYCDAFSVSACWRKRQQE